MCPGQNVEEWASGTIVDAFVLPLYLRQYRTTVCEPVSLPACIAIQMMD